MARRKPEVEPMKPDTPVYPIGVAARLIGVHPRTLRIYEAEGLVNPSHVGSRRLFSDNDIQWIRCLRSFIHDEGVSIPGLKKLLNLIPCWEVAGCPPDVHESCGACMQIDVCHYHRCHKADTIHLLFPEPNAVVHRQAIDHILYSR